jgi:sugar (pentulose or hexulose) kinase
VRESVLGVDVGTGSLKAGLFTLSGEAIGFEQSAYGLSSPGPGREINWQLRDLASSENYVAMASSSSRRTVSMCSRV